MDPIVIEAIDDRMRLVYQAAPLRDEVQEVENPPEYHGDRKSFIREYRGNGRFLVHYDAMYEFIGIFVLTSASIYWDSLSKAYEARREAGFPFPKENQ